ANVTRKSTYKLVVNKSETLPLFHGNFQRIEQALVNIILNACQAIPTPDLGITITTDCDRSNNTIQLSIQDEGTGISGEIIDRVTDPFFTTKRDTGGTGLGLSIVSGIMKEHGGKLGISSQPDKGTIIALQFPLKQERTPF
ncbi:histidine kinase, partial [bacterium F16]